MTAPTDLFTVQSPSPPRVLARSARSLAAEAAFRKRLAELDATLLEPQWLGSGKPHRVRCAQGHDCTPRPTHVLHGKGICRPCAGNDSSTAEAAFRALLTEQGATLLEPRWLGSQEPHRVRCAQGHDCAPRPAPLQMGRGLCATCARRDPRAAEAAFRERLAELGATLLEPWWLGNRMPHRVRCAQGHDCAPRPTDLVRGQGICSACVGHDPTTSEAAFRARLTELGATLLEPRYMGAGVPHRARCAEGHDCTPRPADLRRGRGVCLTCSGNDPKVAEAAFRARLTELGATLLEPRWLGKDALHRAVCAEGHPCAPLPSYVRDGGGICRTCAGKVWDVLYVVTDEAEEIVKVGITSGDPRPRLAVHRRYDLDRVVRLVTGLPAGVASELERTVLAAMADAREQPVRGREYFHARVLPLMLDLIDHHPAVISGRTGESR